MKVHEAEGISLKGSLHALKESLLAEAAAPASRAIQINGAPKFKPGCNEIRNGKYRIYDFLPLVLYYQFQHFFNLYFLGLTITQFIPALKVGRFFNIMRGFMINYVGPLSLVIGLSILKEAYDDFQRHKRDRQINNQIYQIHTPDCVMDRKSGNLAAGMIVQINQNERVPADVLILKTLDPEGHVFIRTDQLDGETDWKLRKAASLTQNAADLTQVEGTVSVELPHTNIYSFKGLLETEQKESLSIENVIWANTVLATGTIFGLVIYNGQDSKMVMNQKVPQSKKGIFDREVDKLSKLSFVIMVILAGIITFFSSPSKDAGFIAQSYMRYLILVSNIIPISMRVNLEFAKLIYSVKINQDKDIEGTITRNSNIPESLGRISYLLCDKTGTLTKNEMQFKKLQLENKTYNVDNFEDMRSTLHEQSRKGASINKKDQKLKEVIQCISICHNVTPIDDEYNIRTYQASSPDEIALVKFAEQLGFYILQRDEKAIKLQTAYQTELIKILNCFPFSSETKRMGIIVQIQNQITFFSKGADVIMKTFLPGHLQAYVDEECENLAREGLRTLVLCKKDLEEREYQVWAQKFVKANQVIEQRELAVREVISELETGMEFLGITGVEDRLQDDVAHTIENLRQAGISVWMLTGDKLETAICISILSGLKHINQRFIVIKDITDEIEMKLCLDRLEVSLQSVLVIDGTSLTLAMSNFEQVFLTMAMNCQVVVCCRCSPTQKAEIASLLKKYSQKVVACIGDGGNDVGMIQSADVGIGIEGKEGKQAALASDFSILKFSSLNQLLLWHGRLSYRRSALLSQFIIHRGFLIATVQAIFMFVFYFLSISLFSGLLMLGYSTIFTMFPVFCIIFDEDVKLHIALKYPPLYKTLQKGRFLNTKTFLVWLWKAVFQGLIIMISAFLLIDNAFLKIETTVFTCLIFTQFAMTLTELETMHIVMIIANLLSLFLYILVMLCFPSHLIISRLDWTFFLWVLLILVVSWVPLYVAKKILKIVDPSDSEKLMKNVQRDMINFQ